MKSTTVALLLVVSILVVSERTLQVDAFLPSQQQHRGYSQHSTRETSSVVRNYEPLPNDSLGNFQDNNARLNQPTKSEDSLKTPSQSSSLSESTTKASPPPLDDNIQDRSGPDPRISGLEVVTLLMDALQNTPNPQKSLELCFLFSSDRCRAAVGGSLEEFVKYANNPTFGSLVHCQDWRVLSVGPIIPGSMHRGEMQTVLIEITKPLTVRAVLETKAQDERKSGRRRPTIEERIQARKQQRQQQQIESYDQDDNNDDEFSHIMDPEDDGKKTFLWTLQKERRPPRQDCWLVHEVLYKRNAFLQTF